jgi:hypothetical protein
LARRYRLRDGGRNVGGIAGTGDRRQWFEIRSPLPGNFSYLGGGGLPPYLLRAAWCYPFSEKRGAGATHRNDRYYWLACHTSQIGSRIRCVTNA